MKNTLRISPDLSLPLDVVTTTIAVLGIRNSGKTNTCVVLTEELFDAGQQVVIIDPTDVWWGLKSSEDGKHEGHPVVVFGGRHGDVPLSAGDGATVADFIVEERLPAILSLRHFESQADQRRFVTEFARRLYHRKGEEGRDTPMLLVIDEAHLFVPQRVTGAEAPMVGAVQKLVRQGRSSGIGVAIIDQRPASVNKDVLTQIELLICHRTTSPQDSRALEAWIEQNDTEDQRAEFLKKLPELKRGVAWCWSPGWLKLFKLVAVRARKTFDSSATPKAGEKRVTPTTLAHIDLDALKKRMSQAIEKAQADDPKLLRARISDLQLQLDRKSHEALKRSDVRSLADSAHAQYETPEPERIEVPVEVPVISDEHLAKVEQLVEAISESRGDLVRLRSTLEEISERVDETCEKADAHLRYAGTELDVIRERALFFRNIDRTPPPPPRAAKSNGHNRAPVAATSPSTATSSSNGGELPAGEQAVLTAIAQHRDGVSREQITILTGYKKSTRDAYIARLAQRGFCTAGPPVRATDEGKRALGPNFKPLPKGRALREHWLEHLPAGEREVFKLLIHSFPTPVSRDDITDQTKYKKSTRDAYIARLSLRKLAVGERGKPVTAARELFEA